MRKKGIRNKEDNLKWGYRFKSALGNTYFNVLKLLDDYMIDEDEIYRYSGLKLLITKDSLLLGSCPIHGSNYHSMKGKDYSYFIDEEKASFYRVGNMSPMAKMLIKSVSETDDNSFTIGKKKLPEFYYRILPKLIVSPEIEVIENGEVPLKNYLPVECEITYYMDANEDYISGRVQAKYGDEEITLHKLTDSDFPFPESRDMEYEQNALSTLEKYLPDVSIDGETFACEKTGENTYNLLNEGLKDLMAIGEIHASKDFENLKIRKAPVTRVGVSVESGILNLEISTDDMSEDELLELLESYRKKKKFFKLKNGEFIRLEQDSLHSQNVWNPAFL